MRLEVVGNGSADWQSAVSRIGNPQGVTRSTARGSSANPAEYHSATPQTASLRYGLELPASSNRTQQGRDP